MQESFSRINHSLHLENRESLSLTGVKDVDSFNEEEICAKTDYGELSIKGNELHVEVLDLESGELKISGKIIALIYNDKSNVKSGIRRFLT